ncbi:sulfite exporter TauE/SafE family protein [[Eubacterium] cellulosolvens]
MIIPSVLFIVLGGLGVFLIGISKAGFGMGAGNLAVPLIALVVSSQQSVAILLPILCVADLFSLWFYKDKWNIRLLKMLMPSTVIGIVVGSFLLGVVSDFFLKKIIGLIAIAFVALQFMRYILRSTEAYKHKKWHGIFIGSIAGVLSTVAHAAGPVLSIFLLPMRLAKEVFVATVLVYFAIVNYVKLVPYFLLGLFDYHTFFLSGILLPFVPLGVYVGFRLNQRLSSRGFILAIYVLLLITGIQLLIGVDISEILVKS